MSFTKENLEKAIKHREERIEAIKSQLILTPDPVLESLLNFNNSVLNSLFNIKRILNSLLNIKKELKL